jgi:hypothetical protein
MEVTLRVNGPVCCGECDTDKPDLSEEFDADQPTWMDRSGKEWRLVDMTDSHLQNAHRMMGRIVSALCLGPGPQGEMAQDYYEMEIAAAERAEDELAAEIHRRRAMKGAYLWN